MRPVQQKSPPPPCCQPIVAIVTWTMSTKAQLLWGDGGDGGALHLLMTQFSFQASVLWLFLSFLFGHLCPHFIIDCDRGSNKKSTKNHYSAPMNAPPPQKDYKVRFTKFFLGTPSYCKQCTPMSFIIMGIFDQAGFFCVIKIS